jgi:Domain of unknown function (DUF4276)
MARVLILAEGQTEERFIKQVLEPSLAPHGVYIRASIIRTKEPPAGSPYKGGFFSYNKIAKDVFRLLEDTDAIVTSMFDLYGLPNDFPGVTTSGTITGGVAKAKYVESAFKTNIDRPRFRPFIMPYEFEALVFASPNSLGEHFDDPNLTAWCSDVVGAAGSPEAINDGPTTHPSQRLSGKISQYKKVTDGPQIVGKEGLNRIRNQCAHFNEWMLWMEHLT